MYSPVESKGNENNGKNGSIRIKMIHNTCIVQLLFYEPVINSDAFNNLLAVC